MRDLFPGYYKPTKEEFDKLWDNCTFSFDANVLLNIYKFTPSYREIFFDILKRLEKRIWLPHQVALEYQKCRHGKISEQRNAYEYVRKKLKTLEAINKMGRQPYINMITISEIIDETKEKIESELKNAKEQHPDHLDKDVIREFVDEIFTGKVGEQYSNEDLKTKYQIAKERFEQKSIPGYKDMNKREPDMYNDSIIWFQLLDHATIQEKPIIFITDETKEDWWFKPTSEIIGPKPELINEMYQKASVQFYLYSTEQFINHAQDYLELQKNQEIIDAAREIRQQAEAQQRYISTWTGTPDYKLPYNNVVFQRQLADFVKTQSELTSGIVKLAMNTDAMVSFYKLIQEYTSKFEESIRSVLLTVDPPFLRICKNCGHEYYSMFLDVFCPNCGPWIPNEQDLDDTQE